MEPREFALTHLPAIRKAAVDLLETIRHWRLDEGQLDPRSDPACFSHTAMCERMLTLEHTLEEWGNLIRGTPYIFNDPDKMFSETGEAEDAFAAWSLLCSSYWNLCEAGFYGGHVYGNPVPVKVEEKIVAQLRHGIELLGRFEERRETETDPPAKGKRGTKKTKTRKIDVAITIVVRNPELDDAEVAKQANCHRSYLTKSREHQRNADMARQAAARQQRQAVYDARSGRTHLITTDQEVDC